MNWPSLLLGLCGGSALASVFWGWRFRLLKSDFDDLTETLTEPPPALTFTPPAEARVKFEATIVDWGPNFTGDGDTLPRWRWTVTDQEREVVVMLGNTTTVGEAISTITEWMESNHPGASYSIVARRDMEAI